jgi:hypothetical protein
MSDRAFVDANILVYAHDAYAGEKNTIWDNLMKSILVGNQLGG